ncbi:MAG: hypothetical protein ACKOFI_05430, partial [Phycisphaerales bacterium]
AHDERWHPQPIFNNPPDLYAVFDSLRTARAPDAPVRAEARDAEAAGAADISDVVTRTVMRPDGRVLAVERWQWDGGRLRESSFDLRPRMLRHHAERGVEIATEVEGTGLDRTPYRATSDIEDLPRGASLVLTFRDPLADADRVAVGAGAKATVPDRLEWIVGGVRRTWARFESVRALDAEVDAPREARLARLVGERDAQRRAMAAFDEALRTGADEAFDDATHALAARHEAAGLPAARRADEWWIAAARLADGGRPDRAAVTPWSSLAWQMARMRHRAASASKRARAIARALASSTACTAGWRAAEPHRSPSVESTAASAAVSNATFATDPAIDSIAADSHPPVPGAPGWCCPSVTRWPTPTASQRAPGKRPRCRTASSGSSVACAERGPVSNRCVRSTPRAMRTGRRGSRGSWVNVTRSGARWRPSTRHSGPAPPRHSTTPRMPWPLATRRPGSRPRGAPPSRIAAHPSSPRRRRRP